MTSNLPFKKVLQVDCDLSYSALSAIISMWIKERETIPLTLHITPNNFELAEKVLDLFNDRKIRGMRIEIHRDWSRDSWSVGTRTDFGYGSEGA